MTLPARREWTIGDICTDAEGTGCAECGKGFTDHDHGPEEGFEMAPQCHLGAPVQVIVQSGQKRLAVMCAECGTILGYIVDSQRTKADGAKLAN